MGRPELHDRQWLYAGGASGLEISIYIPIRTRVRQMNRRGAAVLGESVPAPIEQPRLGRGLSGSHAPCTTGAQGSMVAGR